jgi:hypothetical protein
VRSWGWGAAGTALASLASSGALLACTLLVDTSGLTSKDDGAIVSGSDAQGSEGSPGDDEGGGTSSGWSGSSGADGSPGSGGCKAVTPTPVFCEDFEDGQPLGMKWTDLTLTQGAATLAALDDGLSFSPSHSVKFDVVNATGCSYAKLRKNFTQATATRVDMSARLNWKSAWNADKTSLTVIIHGPGGANFCQMLFNVDGDGTPTVKDAQLLVQHDPSFTTEFYTLDFAPKYDTWTAVHISVRVVAGVPTVNISLDGVIALHDTALPQCKLGGPVEFDVGFHCDKNSAELHADDIVADFN